MVIESTIGPRIRQLRKQHKLTLKQLSEKVGCTDAYLSQVENGKVSPSISKLKKIADALRTNIADFFVERRDNDPVVLSPDRRVTLSLSRWNANLQSLVLNPSGKRMHPFFTTIKPGGGSHGLYSHVGEEFGLVLQGELEIELGGETYLVHQGESFYYNSTQPHSWINPGEKDTIVVWVISPPTF